MSRKWPDYFFWFYSCVYGAASVQGQSWCNGVYIQSIDAWSKAGSSLRTDSCPSQLCGLWMKQKSDFKCDFFFKWMVASFFLFFLSFVVFSIGLAHKNTFLQATVPGWILRLTPNSFVSPKLIKLTSLICIHEVDCRLIKLNRYRTQKDLWISYVDI